MATYIILGQFTDQGIKNVKDTTKRAQALKDMAKKFNATVTGVDARSVRRGGDRRRTGRCVDERAAVEPWHAGQRPNSDLARVLGR
jgi:hypothetical protein